MNIGIFLDRKICQLEHGELEIIRSLINYSDKKITLICLLEIENEPSFNISNNEGTLAETILKRQFSFENGKFSRSDSSSLVMELSNYFEQTSILQVLPIINAFYYEFNELDIDVIKNENLDVILQIGNKRLQGGIVNTANYGVWYLYYFNRFSNLPKGFHEIIMNEPVIKISLIRLTENFDQLEIIDKAHFNYHKWSAFLTNIMILESSVSLLLKNLKILNNNKKQIIINEQNEQIYQLENKLTFSDSIKYLLKFYKFYLKGIFTNYKSKINLSQKLWTIFIGTGNFLEQDLGKLKHVKIPKGEFWADPFLLKFKGEYYGFFENYSFKEKKGKISCGRIVGNTITDVIDVLDLEYHLSYPYVFSEGGEIFMMPEASSNKRLEVYKCIEFPNKWELFSTAFEGEKVADAFFYDDINNHKWLFLNKSSLPNSCRTSNLYIYKVDSLKLNTIVPHKQNPVLIDSRVARNGGAIFSYKNKIFRPSQRNTHGNYGGRLNINEIEKLSLEEYYEKPVKIVKPDFYKGLKAIHHLHQNEDLFVFDASFKNIY